MQNTLTFNCRILQKSCLWILFLIAKLPIGFVHFFFFLCFLKPFKKVTLKTEKEFFPTYQLCPTCLIVDFSSLTDVSDSHNRFLLYLMLWHQDKGVQLKSSITQKHFAEKVGQVDTSSTLIFGILLRSEEGNFPIVAT